MKIVELIENQEDSPTLYVANRDFDLHPEVEYKGYVLGSTDHSDDDVRKTSYDVYKFAKTTSYEWNGRKYDQDHYQYVLGVRDPAYDGKHDLSPYHRGDIMPAFKFTVDGLLSGKFSPRIIPRVSMEADELHEDMKYATPVSAEEIDSKFGSGTAKSMSTSKGTRVVFMKDKYGRSWKIIRSADGMFHIDRDFMMEGDSISFEGRNKALVGTVLEVSGDKIIIEGGVFPMIGPEEPPGEMETDLSTMPHRKEMLAISAEIWHLLQEVPDEYDTEDELNYLDDQGRKLGYEPVIGIDPYPFLDINWHHKETNRYFKITPKDLKQDQRFRGTVNEKESGDRRSFTVRMKFEDGGKVTRVFLANDKQEALQKAMKWAKNEYDAEQGVEAKIVAESDAAKAITQAFGGMAAGVKTGLIRRAGLLALQGRYSEAENTIRHLLKDIDPAAAAKIKKAISDIKPVKVGDKVADTSAIEKSKAHTDWLDKTFVPWVEKHISNNLAEREGDWLPAAAGVLKAVAFLIGVPIIAMGQIWKNDLPIVDSPLGKAMYDAAARGDKDAEAALKRLDDIGVQRLPMQYIEKLSDKYLHKGNLKESVEYRKIKATLTEAEYHGRTVKLGKPMSGDVKKYKVYVKDPKTGNVKKVNFGDKGMEIKRDDPARRRNFRARHGCGTPRASNRTKAAYWSCRMWSSKPVSKILKGK